MTIPDNLLYTKEHEWVKEENGYVYVGITDFAADKLGDITFVELPGAGDALNQNDTFGVVESVKAVSDLFSPVSGKIVESNEALNDEPEILNTDPYEKGWIVKIEMSDRGELEDLMSPKDYENFCKEEQ